MNEPTANTGRHGACGVDLFRDSQYKNLIFVKSYLLTGLGNVLMEGSKKAEGYFCGVFSPEFGLKKHHLRSTLWCMWASHQLLVGNPVIFMLQSGSIKAGISPLHFQGEQYL
jgi:hypothetical protein